MGRRFQSLVAAALERHPLFSGLHNNRGAGQPDSLHDATGYGFEIKCRQSDAAVTLDENSWRALENYRNPRLVTILATTLPYPLWGIDLTGRPRGPIVPTRDTPTDGDLERYLTVAVSDIVEAVGTSRMTESGRIEAIAKQEAVLTTSGRGTT